MKVFVCLVIVVVVLFCFYIYVVFFLWENVFEVVYMMNFYFLFFFFYCGVMWGEIEVIVSFGMNGWFDDWLVIVYIDLVFECMIDDFFCSLECWLLLFVVKDGFIWVMLQFFFEF